MAHLAHGASDFQLWNTTLTNTNVYLYNACYLCREEERFELNRHELEQRFHLGEHLLNLFFCQISRQPRRMHRTATRARSWVQSSCSACKVNKHHRQSIRESTQRRIRRTAPRCIHMHNSNRFQDSHHHCTPLGRQGRTWRQTRTSECQLRLDLRRRETYA